MFHTKLVNGQFLLKRRLKASLTQKRLADQAGVSKSTIERAEKGGRLRPQLIAQLAKLLDVSIKTLIAEEEPGSLRAEFAPFLTHLRVEFEDLRYLEIKTIEAGARAAEHVPKLEAMFIEPYLLRNAVSPEATPAEWEGATLAPELLAQPGPKVILGDPGSGKSTLVAWITLQLTAATPFSHALGDRIPIPLILREINLAEVMRRKKELTWEDLLRAFQAWCGKHKKFAEAVAGDSLFDLISKGQAVLLLDGLDEIDSTTRRKIRTALWKLIEKHPENLVICTSRPVGYEDVPFDWEAGEGLEESGEGLVGRRKSNHKTARLALRSSSPLPGEGPGVREARREVRGERREPAGHPDGSLRSPGDFGEFADNRAHEQLQKNIIRHMERLYLAPFDNRQIKGFIDHWYADRLASPGRTATNADGMLGAILTNPSTLTLARIPNVLTIMAILHERRNVLPDGRAKLYAAVVDLYLVHIDQSRGIIRDQEIRATLAEQKLWLGRVAWEIQRRRMANEQLKKDQRVEDSSILLVTNEELVAFITAEAQDPDNPDAVYSASDIIDFLRKVHERAGLVIERGQGRYSFIHLSFVEYFAGHYLLHSFEDRLRSEKKLLPSLSVRTLWHETVIFAIEEARETLHRKRVPLLKLLIPWFNPVTGKAKPLAKSASEEQVSARSNEWVLLTQLSEDRHAGMELLQDRIRVCCTTWAQRVDPVDGDRFARQERFIDLWLAEVRDEQFGVEFWAEIFANPASSPLPLGERPGVRGERREPAGHSDGSLRSPGDFGEIADNGPPLTAIGLSGYGLSPTAARALVRIIAQHLPLLTTLDLSRNQIGDDGAREIAQHLPLLTMLDLSFNQIGDAGARDIAQHLPLLTTLDLWNNQIGEAGAREIAQHLPLLTTLDLSDNQIGEAAKAELRELFRQRGGHLFV